MKVRDNLPSRRPAPSKSPKAGNWREHKSELRKDFHCHCGYCGSYDGFRHTYFEIDHFVPKTLLTEGCGISDCQYDNLVYSCKFCNNIKSDKWPTGILSSPNNGSMGFIDPCDPQYDVDLQRMPDGRIRGNTNLGDWMVKIGFKFDERDGVIKLLWNLNEIRKTIDGLIMILKIHSEGSEKYEEIKRKTQDLAFRYYLQNQELREYYDKL